MILDFFKEDYSEVVGVYYDGEKITLSRHLNGTSEFAEINFSTSTNDEVTEIEQLAEKISVICSQRGWNTSNMGFCLREGQALTFETSVVTIPSSEIDAAVKSWATAQIDKNAWYTSIKSDKEIWMEAISASSAKEFISAWKNNSMRLRALTLKPEEISLQVKLIKPIEYANFVAEVVQTKKFPNLISEYLNTWNYKKISAAIIAIFFCALLGIFAVTSYEYRVATAQVEEIRNVIADYEDDLTLKNLSSKIFPR